MSFSGFFGVTRSSLETSSSRSLRSRAGSPGLGSGVVTGLAGSAMGEVSLGLGAVVVLVGPLIGGVVAGEAGVACWAEAAPVARATAATLAL